MKLIEVRCIDGAQNMGVVYDGEPTRKALKKRYPNRSLPLVCGDIFYT